LKQVITNEVFIKTAQRKVLKDEPAEISNHHQAWSHAGSEQCMAAAAASAAAARCWGRQVAEMT